MSIPGSFFRGTVLKSDPASYLVEVSPQDITLSQPTLRGICVVPFFSKYFGFKDAALPEPDSTVFCFLVDANTCYILGSVVNPDTVFKGAPLRTVQRAVDGIYDGMNTSGLTFGHRVFPHNNGRPSDVVEGERVISNDFGIMLQLMQQFAALKASDLAQIQAFLLDDLVRIVSHNFQHYTSMGGCQIYHDGKYLHAEYGGTHKPGEALGRVDAVPNTEFQPVFAPVVGDMSSSDDENDCFDFVNKQEESITAVERFKLFIGTLGDFFNFFIVGPQPGNTYTLNGSQPTLNDLGLLQVRASADGGLYIRSAKEVFIEKTNWIRVPVRVRAFEDPAGADGATIELSDKALFQFNKEYSELGTPYLYALQMQDYTSYIQEEIGYKNFKAYNKDVFVPDAMSDEAKLNRTGYVDPKTPTELYPVKSGIYLLPNGGIVQKDAWSSAIVMEGGNIYLQPAKDLVVQAGRHVIGKVGGSLNMEVNRHIDFVSATKGMRIKTEQAQYLYSKNGGVVLHSDTENQTLSPENAAPETVGGVVFKSKTAIYNLAQSANTIATNVNVVAENIVNQASRQLTHNMTGSGGVLMLSSNGSTFVTASDTLAVVTDGSLIAIGAGSTVVGTDEQNIGLGTFTFNGEEIPIPVKGLVASDAVIPQIQESVDAVAGFDIRTGFAMFQTQAQVDSLIFRYLDTSAYGGVNEIPMTLAQQTDAAFQLYNYGTWYPNTTPEINNTFPYPGAGQYNEAYVTNSVVANSDKIEGQIYSKATNLSTQTTLVADSLSKYTVYPTS